MVVGFRRLLLCHCLGLLLLLLGRVVLTILIGVLLLTLDIYWLVLGVGLKVVLYPFLEFVGVALTSLVEGFSDLCEDSDVLVFLDDAVRRRTRLVKQFHEAADSFFDHGVVTECAPGFALLHRVILDVSIFLIRLVRHIIALEIEEELEGGTDLVICTFFSFHAGKWIWICGCFFHLYSNFNCNKILIQLKLNF